MPRGKSTFLPSSRRITVSFCVNVTQCGASTVFLLLCAKNIRDFGRAFLQIDVSSCLLILVIALLLLPVTFLKSPNDFWPVVVGGMLSTGIASRFDTQLFCPNNCPNCLPQLFSSAWAPSLTWALARQCVNSRNSRRPITCTRWAQCCSLTVAIPPFPPSSMT